MSDLSDPLPVEEETPKKPRRAPVEYAVHALTVADLRSKRKRDKEASE